MIGYVDLRKDQFRIGVKKKKKSTNDCGPENGRERRSRFTEPLYG